jgi:hypothetical protein
MTTKKTPTKKAPAKKTPAKPKPVKPEPPQVTPEKIEDWRAHVARLAKKAKPYDLDLDDIEKRVVQIEQQIPNPPPVIRTAEECSKHQAHLRKLCHLRTQLTQIQTRCIQAKAVWSHILKVIKGYLWIQPEVVALKNDTARSTVVRKVAGKLEWKYTLVGSLIDASDKVIWTLKDNQRAVQAMIQAANEEQFLYRQGMEK